MLTMKRFSTVPFPYTTTELTAPYKLHTGVQFQIGHELEM